MTEKLANQKISKLLYSLALPAICGQIVSLLYNMVDRIYIGRLPDGNLAMAAIGICVPLTTIINAFNGLFGRGGAPLSSIRLGEENYEEADHILSNSFMSLIIFHNTHCSYISRTDSLFIWSKSRNFILCQKLYCNLCFGNSFYTADCWFKLFYQYTGVYEIWYGNNSSRGWT